MDNSKGFKMLFNTGVKPYNRLNLSGINKGKFELMEFEELKNGTIHKVYFLEEEPLEGLILQYLIPESSLESCVKPYHKVIKIIGGGIMSDYAVFLDYKKSLSC